MSNLTGSVDVVREQERRARLQLLDEIREPSPQPIFGEPVKVELEDETSRRIKNTLGDFTQVLVNDPKSLIGIARGTAAATAASATSRPHHHHHPSNKHQRPGVGPPNGLHKQPPPVAVVRPSHHPHGKRPHHHAAAAAKQPQQPPSGSHRHSHSSRPDKVRGDPAIGSRQRPLPPPQSEQQQQQQPASSAVTVNINISVSGSSVLSGNIVSTSAALVGGATTSPSSPPPPHLVNGVPAPPLPVNGLLRHRHQQQQQLARDSRIAQAKHVLPNLVIPDKGEKGADSHIELETILREMKQAVPPPLTAIQTPRTEDSGFAFPTEELPYTKEEEQTVPSEPPPPPPPPDEPDAPKVVPPNNALSQSGNDMDSHVSHVHEK